VYREAGTFAIRPERITVSDAAPDHDRSGSGGDVCVAGSVSELVYAGAETRVFVELDTGDTVVAVRHNVAEDGHHALRRGQQVWLSWSRRQAVSLGS
jgi:putative spermidine/putrescine transport system ATP-binding protein